MHKDLDSVSQTRRTWSPSGLGGLWTLIGCWTPVVPAALGPGSCAGIVSVDPSGGLLGFLCLQIQLLDKGTGVCGCSEEAQVPGPWRCRKTVLPTGPLSQAGAWHCHLALLGTGEPLPATQVCRALSPGASVGGGSWKGTWGKRTVGDMKPPRAGWEKVRSLGCSFKGISGLRCSLFTASQIEMLAASDSV